jgi:hypothetical protein
VPVGRAHLQDHLHQPGADADHAQADHDAGAIKGQILVVLKERPASCLSS